MYMHYILVCIIYLLRIIYLLFSVHLLYSQGLEVAKKENLHLESKQNHY